MVTWNSLWRRTERNRDDAVGVVGEGCVERSSGGLSPCPTALDTLGSEHRETEGVSTASQPPSV